MTAVGWTGYVPPPKPCTTCKPSPDGSPAVGWVLVAFGVAAVVAAIVLMVIEGWSRPAADRPPADPAGAESPVMDRVQREDVEKRAAEETENRNRLWLNMIGGLAVGGLACAAVGGFLAESTLSSIDDHKKQLHQAASVWLSVVVDGPEICREPGTVVDPAAGRQNSASHCPPSPRDYASQQRSTDATEFPTETVLSANFQSNGEVTFHDTLNNRALCVRVPDTDVAAAYSTAGFPTPDPDVDGYISSGACPDAPVTADPTYQENTSP
jgi:hypothetical protein